MLYPPVVRRVVPGTAIVLFIIVSLAYRSSFGLNNTLVSPSATSTACEIWPDQQWSSPEKLRYEDCYGAAKSPQVGDVGILGSPRHCLLAGSRLDQYHSTEYNWTEVRWGKSVTAYIVPRRYFTDYIEKAKFKPDALRINLDYH